MWRPMTVYMSVEGSVGVSLLSSVFMTWLGSTVTPSGLASVLPTEEFRGDSCCEQAQTHVYSSCTCIHAVKTFVQKTRIKQFLSKTFRFPGVCIALLCKALTLLLTSVTSLLTVGPLGDCALGGNTMGLGLSVMGDRGGMEGTTAFGGSSGGAAPVDDVTYVNAYIYE